MGNAKGKQHAYLVMGQGGYDESDWPVCAFHLRADAERFAVKCTMYASKRPKLVQRYYDEDVETWSDEDCDRSAKMEKRWKERAPDKSGDMRHGVLYFVKDIELR